jgi:hypothetical protein
MSWRGGSDSQLGRSPARGNSRPRSGQREAQGEDDLYDFELGGRSRSREGAGSKKAHKKKPKPKSSAEAPVKKTKEQRVSEILARAGVEVGLDAEPSDGADDDQDVLGADSSFKNFALSLQELRASLAEGTSSGVTVSGGGVPVTEDHPSPSSARGEVVESPPLGSTLLSPSTQVRSLRVGLTTPMTRRTSPREILKLEHMQEELFSGSSRRRCYSRRQGSRGES